MYQSGVNTSGDFDQLSLAGVDFGEDYCVNYGISPKSLEGEYMYSGEQDMAGMDYHQMGTIPEGLGADFNQMGMIPQGLGHSSLHQMGHYPQGLGHYPQMIGGVPRGLMGMGFMDKFQAMSTTNKMLVGVGVAVGGALLLKQMGVIKSLPLIG
jgi:hypothetical protein